MELCLLRLLISNRKEQGKPILKVYRRFSGTLQRRLKTSLTMHLWNEWKFQLAIHIHLTKSDKGENINERSSFSFFVQKINTKNVKKNYSTSQRRTKYETMILPAMETMNLLDRNRLKSPERIKSYFQLNEIHKPKRQRNVPFVGKRVISLLMKVFNLYFVYEW